MTKKVLCVIGTRPEAIKMAPVIQAFKSKSRIECRILATAQHRHMLDQVLEIFDIEPDIDLNIMRPNQSLATLTARLLLDLDDILHAEKPDAILAQGDTTTVMVIALSCFYHRIPFGHVEAGLRTWDMMNPYPEEMNRVFAGKLAKWHFAPTQSAKENLLKEGVKDKEIFVTGNTVIDALQSVVQERTNLGVELDKTKRLILVTAHRRENFGKRIIDICKAIRTLVNQNSDIQVLFPVHYNPNIEEPVYDMLGSCPNVILCSPLEYLPFVDAMKRSYLILSDSGGVQEEAPALGKPVLVLRSETERPEAVDQGVVKIVGTDHDRIGEESQLLLDNKTAYSNMVKNVSPYGDGHAAHRIVSIVENDLLNVKEKLVF